MAVYAQDVRQHSGVVSFGAELQANLVNLVAMRMVRDGGRDAIQPTSVDAFLLSGGRAARTGAISSEIDATVTQKWLRQCTGWRDCAEWAVGGGGRTAGKDGVAVGIFGERLAAGASMS